MDGPTQVFTIHAPLPVTLRYWATRRTHIRRWNHRPWWRPEAWDVAVLGYQITLFRVAEVWHDDPYPRCEGMGSTELTWHNIRWAWEHRDHCRVRWPFPARIKRWRYDRCAECGGRFKWRKDARIGTWGGDEVRHMRCEQIVTLRRQKNTLIGWIRGERTYDWWVREQIRKAAAKDGGDDQ